MNDVAALPPRLHTRPWPGRTGMTTYSDQVDSPHASQSHDLTATRLLVSPSRGAAHACPDVSESHCESRGGR
jgi:hypothetical protein